MLKEVHGIENPSTLYPLTLVDRIPSKNQSSELQSQTDRWVGTFLSETTNLKTVAAFLGAGAAYRLTWMGTLTLGSSSLVRGASFATGLAAESAVFSGVDRFFHHGEAPGPSRPFHRDWCKNAISLGRLRFLG